MPHGYGTLQINDWLWFGIGEFTRFGLGTNYDHNWQGSTNIYKATVETYSINPNLAVKVTDDLSLALGVEYIYGRMDLRKNIKALGEDWHLLPDGDAWTWDAAIHYAPTDWLSFGMTYRDGFRFDASGDARFSKSIADDTVEMKANFPGSLSMGAAVKPYDDVTVELDYIWTNWSSLTKMEYTFTDKTVANITSIATNEIDSLKRYRDASRVQLGVEWLIDDDMALRFGYVFDESPQNENYADYMLPSNDRQIVSSGFGYSWGNWTTDFSLMYLWAADREIKNGVTGTFDTTITNCTTWLGGMSVGYKF